MAGTIDYKTFFEYPTVTRIHGQPTYETLQRLYNELKSNAGSIPSSLGGGANGHLGLILDPRQYATISQYPYVRPMFPGPLYVPPNIPQQMAIMLQNQHKEHVRVFREVQGVENALRQQITSAIEKDYLAALRNRATNSITIPIHEIIKYLFMTYGKITPTKLQEKEVKVKQIVYDPTTPIDVIFNPVDDLVDYANAANFPYSNEQIINLAYIILMNTGKFGNYIREWNRKPPDVKTWVNFKSFFRNARTELNDTSELTAQDTNFHANMIQEIVRGLKEELQNDTADNSYNLDELHANQINEATRDSEVASLQDEVSSLKSMIQQLQTSLTLQHQAFSVQAQQQGHPTVILNQGPPTNTPTETSSLTQDPPPRKNKQVYYCWTHGYQYNKNHTSKTCRFKAQGHKDEATAENRMNGCKKGIRRYQENKNT